MIKERIGKYYVNLILIMSIPILVAILPRLGLWPKFSWANEPVHSSIEAFGAFIAILIASVMWQRKEDAGGKSLFLAAGFISMGILDLFHAVSRPGNTLVFLHSIALLCGGFFFGLSWLPKSVERAFKNKWVSRVVILFSVSLGVWTFIFPRTIPQMALNGKFTNFATAANLIAGIFFLSSALYFLLDFHRSAEREAYLFIYLAILFGISGLMFKYSSLWDSAWWLWHILRLTAYFLTATVIVSRYHIINAGFRQAEERIQRQNIFLDSVIDSLTYPLCVIDANTYKIIKANSIVSKGVLAKDITCYSLTHHRSSPCKDNDTCPLEIVKETKKPTVVEHLHYDKDSNPRYVKVYGSPIFDTKGDVIQMIESSIDITELRQAEEILKKEGAELEKMVEEKTKTLRGKVEELERFRKATIEREFRMKELSDEIARLKAEN